MKKVYELIAYYYDGGSEFFGRFKDEKDALKRSAELFETIAGISEFELKTKLVGVERKGDT